MAIRFFTTILPAAFVLQMAMVAADDGRRTNPPSPPAIRNGWS
ncbi:conserved hypothetical protein [Culex quinquefasciatus]|uniref:Uncharacterized protein n=1 Tax=Culex quinquefasciatus TaxID=7176 RepID=B0XHQ0_CULQU|nr:conserved hypothetical protein [Culex quinquefasciatus]|eukprot:XP_001869172.1 conserved hypothetical protein [Culex quinquefasciatus]